MRILARCLGIAPLICNRTPEDALRAARSRASPRDDSVLPRLKSARRAYCEQRLYTQGGHLGLPGEELQRSLIVAGRGVKAGDQLLTTDVGTLVNGLVLVEDAFLPFPADATWEVDARHGVDPFTHQRRRRLRPRVPRWSFSATLAVDRSIGTEADARALLERAGTLVGLGEFSPRGEPNELDAGPRTFLKRPFGRFIVTSWEALPSVARAA